MEGDGHFLEQNNHLPLKQRDHLCTPFYSCAPVKSKSLNDAAFFNMKVKETWVHEKILVPLFQQKFQLYDSLTPPPPKKKKKKKKNSILDIYTANSPKIDTSTKMVTSIS